jgi:molybdopterin molybdotransferase
LLVALAEPLAQARKVFDVQHVPIIPRYAIIRRSGFQRVSTSKFRAMALLSFDDARRQLLASATPPTVSEDCPIADAWGRVLAVDIASPFDVPGFDNSAMDGYAVCAADLTAPGTRLAVSQRIPAGSVPAPLVPRTAARIFTGAPVPEGADTVVMQEDARADGDAVVFDTVPKAGQFVRKRAHEIRQGGVVLQAGTRLGAGQLGLAASLGQGVVPVWKRLRVAIFFTGSELVVPGQPLGPGQIYNSNRYLLRALLQGLSVDIVDLGIVPDSLEATRAALRDAAARADVIFTSGGMSVGEEDHVRAAVEAEGELTHWKIAVKPGKPVAFGRVGGDGGAAFIGLPGNPVSVWVASITLALPYLRRRMGIAGAEAPPRPRPADFSWKTGDRREFLRVRLDDDGRMQLHPNQDSGAVSSAAWASGLADIPANTTVQPGDAIDYWPAPGFGDR